MKSFAIRKATPTLLCAAFAAMLMLAGTAAQAQYGGSAETPAPAPEAAAASVEQDHEHFPGDGHDHGSEAHEAHAPAGFQERVRPRPDFDFSAWESLPIQEGGLEKSFLTFARDFVKDVTGNANYGGRGPIENVLSMAIEPGAWAREPILKVRHPTLKKVFPGIENGRISPLQLDEQRGLWSSLIQGSDGKAIEKELGKLYFHTDQIFGNEQVEPATPSAMERLRIVPASNFRGDPRLGERSTSFGFRSRPRVRRR
jgi:hypothetical protein